MRHSWKKNIRETSKIRKELKRTNKIYILNDIKECVQCGLRKGYLKKRGWLEVIYFKEDKYLSSGKLPYSCYNKFFNEDEFYIE